MQQQISQLDVVPGVAVLPVIMIHANDKYPGSILQHLFGNG